MQLGDQGIAYLPEGCTLPGGPYPVYSRIDVEDNGSASGEVRFLGEPKYPRPIAIGRDFDLHIPHPDSILGDNVVLRVRFLDESGAVAGYVHGSLAQFRPDQGGQTAEREDAPMGSRDVFVIHGRDERLRTGMFDFLRSLGLNPMEWSRAVELTGKGAPYVGEILDAAFSNAQAVVVLFTPDDMVKLRPELCGPSEPVHETTLTPQARPNVLFESGMAMARQPNRTVMVEIGGLRPFSDVGGRHTIRMDNSPKKRNELATRLRTAGCPVSLTGTDWQTAGDLTPPNLQSGEDDATTGGGQLSSEAEQLLLAASEDASGTVMCVRTMQGLVVSTNNRGFSESNSPRSQARWKAAVDELVECGFLEPVGDRGEVFAITDAGYEAAEGIRKGRDGVPARNAREVTISLAAEGMPPSQTIKLKASTPVTTVRLEYMLSNDTCIVAEEVSLQGDVLEIPVNHDLLRKVWNVPRADRNFYDHSGPAKMGVTLSIGGRTQQYVLPVHMENVLVNNTSYARLVGSKTFHGA
jgi:predicted nucleotide-binding protein